MANKNINEKPIASSLSASDYAFISQGNQHKRVQVSKLIALAKADALTETDAHLLDKLTDGCFIFYHRAVENTDNYPVACKASAWTAKQIAGEIANGVLLIQGGKHLVIAPTGSAKIHWGSVTTTAVNQASSDRVWAMNDFDGKTKTAAIVASTAYGGDGADYAPAFCSTYSRTNNNGRGLTAGRWWLPSMGELAMIWANKQKLNLCLQLIAGGQTLPEDAHWSSSEASATGAWFLNLNSGRLGASNKVSDSIYARPVSAFLN